MLIFKYKACTITRFIQTDNIKITAVFVQHRKR